jgi:hypothetical protein
MNIVYLHGFRSSGEGSKFELLKSYFEPKAVAVFAPTLDANPSIAVNQIRTLLNSLSGKTIVIGTSLGGFYSLYCAAKFGTVSFAINPSLEPHLSLTKKVGLHTRYETNEPYIFKEEYLIELEKMFLLSHSALPMNLNFYLANDDEELTFEKLDEYFPERRTLKRFDNAKHRFKRFAELLPDFEKELMQFEGK